jgi:hypothetical protein
MSLHPVLRALGFEQASRIVIIHADDVGMCEATVSAFVDLVSGGLVSSGSVMVPCPWFPQMAAYCRDHPSLDVGVHLTLTSEWDTYRWGPISTRDPASGLLDEEGYFHRRQQQVAEHADVEAVRVEMQAQLERAQQAGIDVTHLDAHMFAAFYPQFLPHYVQLGIENGLPTLLWRMDGTAGKPDDEAAIGASQLIGQWAEQGLFVFDRIVWLMGPPEERLERARAALDALPPGLTHFFIHPAKDTAELRAMAPDWRGRVADYEAFMSPALSDYIRRSGIRVITYKCLRDAMR